MQVAGATIGVVEDDYDIRASLDGLLQSAGFRVVTFASATALLSSIYLPMLACLILDLHMSGMDGLRLQRHLADAGYRSEERRVGKVCVSTCRTRWSTYHQKKQTHRIDNRTS